MWALSAYLDNTQSVARDHLANERTFLAWLRTSLTFASVGVALTQLFRLTEPSGDHFTHRASIIMGCLFIGTGILILVIGTSRYFHVQHVLQQSHFPATRAPIWLVFFLSISLAAVTLGIVVKVASLASYLDTTKDYQPERHRVVNL